MPNEKSTEWSIRQEKESKDVVESISHYVNNMSHKPEHFVEQMSYQHRTLQQSFTRICVAWLLHLAEMERKGFYDLRNEGSVKLAKELKPTLEKFLLPFV